MIEAYELACPECGGILKETEYPSGCMLNRDQWESSIAGDCYCTKCKSEAAATGYRYYWKSKLAGREPEATPNAGNIAGSVSANGSAAFGIIDPEYARIYTVIRLLAWQEGYAAMMHGSFTRDLDLVAVPWTDKACEPEQLVRRVLASNLNLRDASPQDHGSKPHGRKVWTLVMREFGDPRFVDFSIMPPNDEVRQVAGRQPEKEHNARK